MATAGGEHTAPLFIRRSIQDHDGATAVDRKRLTADVARGPPKLAQ
jgi:hypothetical protein